MTQTRGGKKTEEERNKRHKNQRKKKNACATNILNLILVLSGRCLSFVNDIPIMQRNVGEIKKKELTPNIVFDRDI